MGDSEPPGSAERIATRERAKRAAVRHRPTPISRVPTHREEDANADCLSDGRSPDARTAGLDRLTISRVPTWLPRHGATGLVLVDSPITPASAINNTASTSPDVPDRYAHLLKHGVERSDSGRQHGRRCVKHLTILTVRRHRLSTFPAIGYSRLSAYLIGCFLATCLSPPAPIIRRVHIGLRHLISGVSHQASKQPPRRACLFGLAGDEIGERL